MGDERVREIAGLGPDAVVDRLGGYRSRVYRVAPSAGGAPVVVRFLPSDASAADVQREVDLLRALARTPVPVPAVVAYETNGDRYMVLECVPGTSLMQRMHGVSPIFLRVPSILADTLAEIHRAPLDGIPSGEDALEHVIARSNETHELAAVAQWLRTHRPPHHDLVLCHGDFNPPNVLVDERGRCTGVVDWSTATVADPHYDVADVVVTMVDAPIDGPNILWLRRAAARAFIRAYERRRPIASERLRYYEVVAAARRYAGSREDRLTGEGLSSDAYEAALARRIRKITGITCS